MPVWNYKTAFYCCIFNRVTALCIVFSLFPPPPPPGMGWSQTTKFWQRRGTKNCKLFYGDIHACFMYLLFCVPTYLITKDLMQKFSVFISSFWSSVLSTVNYTTGLKANLKIIKTIFFHLFVLKILYCSW